jgi:hypothetical protein
VNRPTVTLCGVDQMIQFYVSTKYDVGRCSASFDGQLPITITGTTDGSNVETFTGVVLSIDVDESKRPNMRWRVTMTPERE